MKITFFSNFLNHHQLYLSQEIINCGCDYTFVATDKIPQATKSFGYEDMNEKYDFVLRTYESDQNVQKAYKLALDSDVVILGNADKEFVKERLEQNKLTFIYAERLFKKGTYRRFIPTTRKTVNERFTKHNGKNLHVLAASAYLALDLKLIGFKNPVYKWGYFPQVKEYEVKKLIDGKQNNPIKILWAGRFLKLKRTRDILYLASKLKSNGYDFSMDIIGKGVCEQKLKQLVKKLNITDKVNFLGSMPSEKVREHMEKANIYLFTSNFHEGWGAVLNEAMNSGCAVVASHAIGSVPYLIKHGENGFIYKMGDINSLYGCVKELIDNPQMMQKFGEKAYYTLKDSWNPEIAAKRLVNMAQSLLSGNTYEYEQDVLSKSQIITQKYKR
ncbi:MAG: glycosyltransferase [Oscillospiraceae bacterium]|nr:glycosyltransferase [Oscillospiraceae bacterium]